MHEKKVSGISVLIIALMFLAMLVSGFASYQLSAAPTQVFAHFAPLNNDQYAGILAASMIPAIFLSIVSGLLVDRFGIRTVLGISFAITAAGLLIRPFISGYPAILPVMVLVGFAVMTLSANLSKAVSAVLPEQYVAPAIGLIMVGGTGSMTLTYLICPHFPNLTVAFWASAIPFAMVTAAWWLFVRNKHFMPAEQPAKEQQASIGESLRVCLSSRNVWVASLCMFFLMGGATVITNFHIVALGDLFRMDDAAAGKYGTVLTIGAMLGSILVPLLLNRIRSFRLFLLVSGLVTAASAYLLISGLPAAMYVSAFLNGALRSGIISVMYALPVMFPEIGERYAGTAGGVIVTLNMLGAVVIPKYVVVPLCGESMTAYFICSAAAFLIFTVISLLLPNLKKNA